MLSSQPENIFVASSDCVVSFFVSSQQVGNVFQSPFLTLSHEAAGLAILLCTYVPWVPGTRLCVKRTEKQHL